MYCWLTWTLEQSSQGEGYPPYPLCQSYLRRVIEIPTAKIFTLKSLLHVCIRVHVLVYLFSSSFVRHALSATPLTPHSSEVKWNYFNILFFYFIIRTLFPVMFSCGANTSKAARDRWCCQLCVKLVSELSNQRCSHLRNWQSAVVWEQQTHFSITPLCLSPPPPPPLLLLFSAHFIRRSSSVHSSYPLSFFLSFLYFPIFPIFPAVSPVFSPFFIVWFCCQPGWLMFRQCQDFFFFFFLLPTIFPQSIFLSSSILAHTRISYHLSPHQHFSPSPCSNSVCYRNDRKRIFIYHSSW